MSQSARVIDRGLLKELPLPEHGRDASKADRGKLLVVAGSMSLPGAAILSATAALRVGCGTVRVATPRSVALAVGVAVPELMVVALPETSSGTIDGSALSMLERQHKPCDAAVIGPGLDQEGPSGHVAARFAAGSPLPTVVDAGALLAWGKAGHVPGAGPRVLTPHAGEMSELSGLGVDEIEGDREEVAARFAGRWCATLVLKGPRTVVAGHQGGLYVNTAGTPGLGTAGSGDVLAGVIAGLLARGCEPTAAAVWGVHLHALAGEIAAARRGDDGMTASDVAGCLPDALRSLRGTAPRRAEP